jgi:hypothetical protein
MDRPLPIPLAVKSEHKELHFLTARFGSVAIYYCFIGILTLRSPSRTTKHSLQALYPLLYARSVLICFTSPLRSPPVVMSLVTAVLSTGSTLISNALDQKVNVLSAKKPVPSAAP